ncbi:CDP-glycerol glycerophosphotransferase family protein, partial [Staphylococcus gallinarum]
LIEAIKQIDLTVEKYKEKYETFYQKYCYLEDGNATKRIVDKVIK